jgi:hypothetical protein
VKKIEGFDEIDQPSDTDYNPFKVQ